MVLFFDSGTRVTSPTSIRAGVMKQSVRRDRAYTVTECLLTKKEMLKCVVTLCCNKLDDQYIFGDQYTTTIGHSFVSLDIHQLQDVVGYKAMTPAMVPKYYSVMFSPLLHDLENRCIV